LFNLSTNLEAAANDVRDKVSQAVRNLPQDIDSPPVVTKADANSDFIILMAVAIYPVITALRFNIIKSVRK